MQNKSIVNIPHHQKKQTLNKIFSWLSNQYRWTVCTGVLIVAILHTNFHTTQVFNMSLPVHGCKPQRIEWEASCVGFKEV
jgi:hypothetical protein